MQAHRDGVDYRLLQRRSSLLLCTSCFRRGITTPIPQIVSEHHKPKTVCPSCEAQAAREPVAVT